MTDVNEWSCLKVRADEGVVHVTFDRPQARNAMNAAMVRELERALEVAVEAKARAIVLRGSGGHFCAGGDIKDMAAARMKTGEGDAIAELNATFGLLALKFARAPMPSVAVLEGAVMGGGFGLACCVDVAIALPSAKFSLPETRLGVLPAQIAPFLVERIGYSQAKRLALTGASLGSDEALAMGLVHHTCSEDECDALVTKTTDAIKRCAPGAVAATKRLLQEHFAQVDEDTIRDAAALFAKAARGPEAGEGMRAFMEKRPAKW